VHEEAKDEPLVALHMRNICLLKQGILHAP